MNNVPILYCSQRAFSPWEWPSCSSFLPLGLQMSPLNPWDRLKNVLYSGFHAYNTVCFWCFSPFFGEEFQCEVPRRFRYLNFYLCEKTNNKQEKVSNNLCCISLLLPRLPKLPRQCYSNGPGNLSNLDSNKEIQPDFRLPTEWNQTVKFPKFTNLSVENWNSLLNALGVFYQSKPLFTRRDYKVVLQNAKAWIPLKWNLW